MKKCKTMGPKDEGGGDESDAGDGNEDNEEEDGSDYGDVSDQDARRKIHRTLNASARARSVGGREEPFHARKHEPPRTAL